jgi:hypothetical protein
MNILQPGRIMPQNLTAPQRRRLIRGEARAAASQSDSCEQPSSREQAMPVAFVHPA